MDYRVFQPFRHPRLNLAAGLQEYQEDGPGLGARDGEIDYITDLYGCENTTVAIKGKADGVTLGLWTLSPIVSLTAA